MSAQPNQEWQLRLFGEFSLTEPSGLRIRLPDRKTEGLLAILGLNREYGIARHDLAEILWPGRSPENLANLRQGLSVLRHTLGDHAIEASRSHCRLTSLCRIVSDYEKPELRANGGFMPGHDSDWFEDVRLESIESDDAGSIVSHFLQTLQWYAGHDSRGMYALLGASPQLARGLPYASMLPLLNSPKEGSAGLGWYWYWRGTVEHDLEDCARFLREAIRAARVEDDLNLASLACLELGKVYSRIGNLAKALRICDMADSIAARSQNRSAKANALRLRGTVLVNWQDQIAGLDLLVQAEDLLDDPIEFATALSVRALFTASVGLHEQAEAALKDSYALSKQLGHFRIGLVNSSTQALLKATAGSREEALLEFEKLSTASYAAGATQTGVYTEELIAKLHFLEGDKGLAATRLNSSREARRTSQMVVTPLEAKRVAQVR